MKILYKTLTHKNNKIKKLKLSGSFFAGKLIDIKYIAKALMHKNNKLKCLDLSGSGFDIDPLIYALIHENNKLEFLNLSFNFLWREFSYLSFEKLMLIFKALRHRNNKIRYIIMGPFEFNKDNEYLKDEIKREINKTLNVLERRHRKIALRLIHFKI